MLNIRFITVLSCLFFSACAFASNQKVQWEYYLIAITAISTAGAWWITSRKQYEARVVKVLMAGVYFWGITFAQFMVVAALWSAFK